MEEFKMPEEMTIEERPEEVTAASVILGEVKTQEEKVKEWLDEVYATKLKQRPGIGVVNEGVIDDEYLAKVKARAAQTILENITKLYKTKVKKVAIVGTAMSYKEAPYGDPSWEIWGLNDHWNLLPRATRWFESQSEEHCAATNCTNGTGLPRMEWYRKAPIPVYMPDHYASAPMSIKYPLREIQAWLSEVDPQGFNYFTNTVSFMIALALYEGFDIIHLFGVDMAVGCLSPETKVLTADLRWVRSDSVKVGDELMGFDEESKSGNGKTRKWRKTIVTKTEPITRPCYEINLEDGTKFIASSKHGWLTHGENENRWKTTEELITKHHVNGRPTRILKMIEPWETENSRDMGYLAGAFDGEGSFSQRARTDVKGCFHYALNFSQKNNEMKQKVFELLDKYKFKYTLNDVNQSDVQQVNIKGGKAEVMRFLGMIRPYRLLPKFNPETMGEFQRAKNVAVINTKFIGEQSVIGMETDTKTFIAEGFASHNSEYEKQRPSCEFFLGIAKGLKVELYIPEQADLLKCMERYGMRQPGEEHKKDAFMKKMDDRREYQRSQLKKCEEQIKQRQDDIQRLSATMFKYQGSLEDVDQTLKVWGQI
jgi:hypothetical protein